MNELLDNLSDIDFSFFTSMKLEDISCWEHIQLQTALHGIEIDSKLSSFLIVMSFFHENILEAIVEALKDGRFNTAFLDVVSMLETLYKMSDFKTLSSDQLHHALIEYDDSTGAHESDPFGDIMNVIVTSTSGDVNKWKSKLFQAANKFSPMSIVKFYAKWSRILHQYDMPFVRFTLKLVTLNTLHDNRFKTIYEKMSKIYQEQNNISMFLN